MKPRGVIREVEKIKRLITPDQKEKPRETRIVLLGKEQACDRWT